MAIVYAGVGLAPLVYTYLAAREARSEYEKRIEEAIREPLVPVHVIVVVNDEDVEARLVPAEELEDHVAEVVATQGGEAVVVTIAGPSGPRIEGIPPMLEAQGIGVEEATA
jgi:hypothetical protein